ncbi:Panacea domain-containing protein [Pseudomonas oryzihabitans]|uniref:Panacea domain-containing protein n=1 Tax=Pseudomonas oryzihabitans TaxID=47885 RepID=UPI00119EC034|nr:type II toxin-antitoxin system antitoxin SocA domain-containing protein [Pseudomonas psychrotolerans]
MGKNALAVAQKILDVSHELGDPSVTPMQLLKLVYIAHGYMLGKHSTPLLDKPVQAWQYGPVEPSVYDAVRKYRSMPVQEVANAPRLEFSEDELDVIRTVVRKYGKVDGLTLSAATHQSGTPWSVTWGLNGRNSEISNDLIENFYRRLLSQPRHSSL